MLYRVGTTKELPILRNRLPEWVYEDVSYSVAILDREYGTDRNSLQSGGYCLIAETTEDMAAIRDIINYDSRLSEWVDRLGPDGSFIRTLYLLNDDFSITLYIPIAIAPITVTQDLEEEK